MRRERPHLSTPRRVLVTGGAGFIGCNLTASLLQEGAQVTVLDSLVRKGAAINLAWLQRLPPPGQLTFVRGDVRNAGLVTQLVRGADEVYHLAAQVAVTSSLEDPRLDFEVNLGGAFNVLEAARQGGHRPFILFTSTNKVYGMLAGGATQDALPENGFDESQVLDFHSPYGCSKGAADQYMRDYARVFHLPVVVFRMSCIYGPHQFGTEDQGWVAHFAMAALAGRPITIYGDGSQIRDLLFVDDLVRAMELARRHSGQLAGQVFNMGGGPTHARSLVQVIAGLEEMTGRRILLPHGPWRVGDQRWYVSDIRRFRQATGWHPQIDPRCGIERLYTWLQAHRAAWDDSVPSPVALAG